MGIRPVYLPLNDLGKVVKFTYKKNRILKWERLGMGDNITKYIFRDKNNPDKVVKVITDNVNNTTIKDITRLKDSVVISERTLDYKKFPMVTETVTNSKFSSGRLTKETSPANNHKVVGELLEFLDAFKLKYSGITPKKTTFDDIFLKRKR